MKKPDKQNNFLRQKLAIAFLFLSIPFLYWRLNQVGYLPPVNYFLSIFNRNFKQNSLSILSSQEALINYDRPITELVTAIDKSQTTILIEKSKYRLTLYYQEQPIKSYPVVFGSNPQGDKLKEGDYKTPEGIFKIRDLYPHSSWSKFIWLDYPNQDSWNKHLQAKKAGKIAYSARIGSEIGIHGVPANGDYLIDEVNNWTWGCISLKNQDVDELYATIQVGTTVKIIP